jgi:uncharacterized membrane protein YdjX (TVP38/TMEM64 family)
MRYINVKKITSIVLTVFVIYMVISQKNTLLDLIHSKSILAAIISIIFVALLVFLPVVPFVVIAGMFGSIFGIWIGIIISFIGIGTLTMFFLARYGFQDWAQTYLNKFLKIKEYENIYENNAFISILIVRVIPVIPSPVINIFNGLK